MVPGLVGLPLLLSAMVQSVLSVPLHQFDASQSVLESESYPGTSRLPVPNPSRSFWIDSPGANPLAAEGAAGDLTEDADICIIGSGITGVSAAWHLANLQKDNNKAPISAVILEARDFCSGATGRNGGHLTPAVFLDFVARAKLYGAHEAAKSYELENHTSAEIIKILQTENLEEKVDLVAGGHTTLFVTKEEEEYANADYEAAKSAGVDLSQHNVTWFSKEEMEKTYGTSFPGVKFNGHNLWPLKFVTELYHLAKTKSPNFKLTLHTRTPATYIAPSSNGRKWLIGTPRGPISCSYVIHATNGYASHLLPHLRGPSGIIPTRGQIIATRAAVSLSELTKTSWDGNQGFEYWFPRPVKDGEENKPLVILGGGREAASPDFELYETDDSELNEETGKALRGFLPGVFPGKYEEGQEPEMEWTGIMGYTKNHDPFVGPIVDPSELNGTGSFSGQFISAGYSGHGMPRAYACAEVVASMISADIKGETWKTPMWLPEHFLTWNRDPKSGL